MTLRGLRPRYDVSRRGVPHDAMTSVDCRMRDPCRTLRPTARQRQYVPVTRCENSVGRVSPLVQTGLACPTTECGPRHWASSKPRQEMSRESERICPSPRIRERGTNPGPGSWAGVKGPSCARPGSPTDEKSSRSPTVPCLYSPGSSKSPRGGGACRATPRLDGIPGSVWSARPRG